jgi:molybdenum cofactor biosynthesis protein MoaC
MADFTHFDEQGQARMVDVAEKNQTERIAVAQGKIYMQPEVIHLIQNQSAQKGDVLGVARVAGIMAAKRTADLIPLCHPLMLTNITIDFQTDLEHHAVIATCTAKTAGRTGVEMEALTGVHIALLTVYDMCKAADRGMVITDICLMEKMGGKSGHYQRR